MHKSGREESYNVLIAPYIAATFVLSFASVLLMRPTYSDSSEEAETTSPSATMGSIPKTWSGICALFDSWTGKALDNCCTKQELQAFKQDMHRIIAERQKVLVRCLIALHSTPKNRCVIHV